MRTIIIIIIFMINTIGRSIATLPVFQANSFQNIRDHIVYTTGNGDPTHDVCIPDRIHRAMGTTRVEKEVEACRH